MKIFHRIVRADAGVLFQFLRPDEFLLEVASAGRLFGAVDAARRARTTGAVFSFGERPRKASLLYDNTQ